MRKVIYREWVMGELSEGTNTVINYGCYIEKEGLFHGFFPTSMKNNDGSFVNCTEALIETENGRIVSVCLPMIRFVDKPEDDQLAEFAKAAMQGLLANPMLIRSHSTEEIRRLISEHAVLQAKSLIAELKKHKQNVRKNKHGRNS